MGVVAERIIKATVAEASLKSNYARVLQDVRVGTSGTEEMWGLLREFYKGEMAPDVEEMTVRLVPR